MSGKTSRAINARWRAVRCLPNQIGRNHPGLADMPFALPLHVARLHPGNLARLTAIAAIENLSLVEHDVLEQSPFLDVGS